MAAGRPNDYTIWKDRAICMRLSAGESLRKICARKYYPSRYAVFRWLQSNEEFRNHYAWAREMQSEHYADDIIDIADDSEHDTIEGPNGERMNSEYVQRSRLRVDTRKWVMERMSPKKYGAKQGIEHSGVVKHDVKQITHTMDAQEATRIYQDMINGNS